MSILGVTLSIFLKVYKEKDSYELLKNICMTYISRNTHSNAFFSVKYYSLKCLNQWARKCNLSAAHLYNDHSLPAFQWQWTGRGPNWFLSISPELVPNSMISVSSLSPSLNCAFRSLQTSLYPSSPPPPLFKFHNLSYSSSSKRNLLNSYRFLSSEVHSLCG